MNASVDPDKHAEAMKPLQLDRHHLEIYTVRGRNMTAYTKRKARLGL